jgi:AcrR family transcriptional regulator
MARTQAADYEQRREAIVDKAAALFAKRGFLGASMADLATACKTSKSLLYHYYASKEELLYAVMSSHIDQLIGELDDVMQIEAVPSEKLSVLVHAFMRDYVGAADRQKVLLNELDNLPRAQRAIIVAKQRGIIASIQQLLAELFGDRLDEAEERVRAMLVLGMLNWTHTWFDPKGPVSPNALADMVVDFTLAASRGAPSV